MPTGSRSIQAIETEYAGCRFRSRLEARWAVALDYAELRWEYEPEGYETPAGRYLPDFRVTDTLRQQWWMEVKPDNFHGDIDDGARWRHVIDSTGTPLVVVHGIIAVTLVILPGGRIYSHQDGPGFIGPYAVQAGRAARFEFGERG